MADDWIMIPALTLVIGMGICGILGIPLHTLSLSGGLIH